jgi:Domain of unknown function (DUF1906)
MADLVGLDCALDCTNRTQDIKNAGVAYVGRYYRWPTSKKAPLTHGEAVALSKAGLFIVALWEWKSDKIANFSHHEGFDQGSSAYKQAMNALQPAGTPIYFAVDDDFSAAQISGPINDYFQGVADAFNAFGKGASAYLVGVYGSGRACDWLVGHNKAARSWLARSPGWAGHDTYKSWDINQGADDLHVPHLAPPSKTDDSGDYDSDAAKPSYGGFQVLT